MRIYAAADIHARPERVRTVTEAVARLRPDLVALAGDLCHFRRPEALLDRFAALPVPIVAVRGATPIRGASKACSPAIRTSRPCI